jgi:hypothetical protein
MKGRLASRFRITPVPDLFTSHNRGYCAAHQNQELSADAGVLFEMFFGDLMFAFITAAESLGRNRESRGREAAGRRN